jgi:cyclopropane-fatty-acyl-phospholipid synthase
MSVGIPLAERGWIPDSLLRVGIRRLLARRLDELRTQAGQDPAAFEGLFAAALAQHEVAERTDAANAQHYEVPTAFFQTMLGPNLKYSSAYYPDPDTGLADAEEAMLKLTAEHAELRDNLDILELGCGWGSLTLWMADHYPKARITAVTNSATQAEYVSGQARSRGLRGVHVLHANVNTFLSDQHYDRIVSVEMFEHMRNYERLFQRLGQWLKPGGKLFVHVFSHARFPYLFEDHADDDWMARHFFTGGTMPSHGLLPRYAGTAMALEQAWRLDGRHYARTLEHWLHNLDVNRARALHILAPAYGGRREARLWLQRWRMFLMACSELFGYAEGEEWGVSHYRFTRRDTADVAQAVGQNRDARDARPR